MVVGVHRKAEDFEIEIVRSITVVRVDESLGCVSAFGFEGEMITFLELREGK
jgi:hypothetical protein